MNLPTSRGGVSIWNPEFEKPMVSRALPSDGNPRPKGRGIVEFNQVIQEMINRGSTVKVLETRSGWMEIHTFENYKTACSQLYKI